MGNDLRLRREKTGLPKIIPPEKKIGALQLLSCNAPYERRDASPDGVMEDSIA